MKPKTIHKKGKPSPLKGRKFGAYPQERKDAISEGMKKYHASKYIR